MKIFGAVILIFSLTFSLVSMANSKITLKKVLVNKLEINVANRNSFSLKVYEKDLILEFKLLSDDSTTYFYRLAKEENWTETPYPIVQFHNLEGGDYTLEIKAKIKNIFTETTQIKIAKEKDFFQKNYFWPGIGAYILLIFGILAYLFSLYDFRNKLKVQFMRNRIAADLHDEVGSNLNSIAIFIEVLKKKIKKEHPELLSILDKIIINSEETVSLMRETVWSINPENDSAEKLFDRMKGIGYEILSVKKIQFHFENNLENKKINMTMEQRRNIYLIYKEAINNILKHSKATKVMVKIAKEGNNMNIQITDNGCGFDKNEIFEGNGLKNFKSRGGKNDIEIEIESELRKGTRIGMLAKV